MTITSAPLLPAPRGPVSAALLAALAGPPADFAVPPISAPDPLHDEDLQLTLYLCYEQHFQGFAGVDPDWEWSPALLALRAAAERPFLSALRVLAGFGPQRDDVPQALLDLVSSQDGPSLAEHVRRHATLEQFRELLRHRSIYQLKEADPHTFAIPRLRGAAKAALVEIQIDEYGGGRLPRMHAELFRTTMDGMGVDSTYGAHVDRVPAVTLAIVNQMSFFGLHRRWRGALVGQLAAFEMTSTAPNRHLAAAVRRLGGDDVTARFFDEHVEADAVHEQVAAYDLAGSYAAENPGGARDVLFGARCGLALDDLFARHVIAAWEAGRSSLLPALTVERAA
ncbi:iron-containing redox enzyme family protein [Asanoa sp. WMMD1127]|uniref:iron-containing redox enzyme family protein n=1 Tax=Asanoa sp. WMMD1127 TaxID=3016107 RepID=UPI002415A1EA|nr:iron-containing redox enzyme family protein [Asanoa sp. WMMD1127]MDG4826344.1 iron-containing redox enzyme family protein [Asanoa sp. WMMD1127]